MSSDEILFEAYRGRGDRAALDELFRRHVDAVYRTTRRILRNDADAQDATQSVFLNALRSASTWRAETSFAGWLYRIAVNAALERARSRKSPALASEPVSGGTSQEEAAMRNESAHRVERAVGELPDEYRLPIQLHYYEGLSYEQVAEALSCPAGTVATRLHRGMERLRHSLAASGLSLTVAALVATMGEAEAASAPAALVDSISRAALSAAPPAVPSAPVKGSPSPAVPAGVSAKPFVLAAVLLVLGGATLVRFLQAPQRSSSAPGAVSLAGESRDGEASREKGSSNTKGAGSADSTDSSLPLGFVTGRVVDSNGRPLPGWAVFVVIVGSESHQYLSEKSIPEPDRTLRRLSVYCPIAELEKHRKKLYRWTASPDESSSEGVLAHEITDSSGRFSIPVEKGWSGKSLVLLVRTQVKEDAVVEQALPWNADTIVPIGEIVYPGEFVHLRGKVCDSVGKGCAGVHVGVSGWWKKGNGDWTRMFLDSGMSGWLPPDATDEQGAYHAVYGIRPWQALEVDWIRVLVYLDKVGYVDGEVLPESQKDGSGIFHAVLRAASEVSGRVVDAEGQPLEGVIVEAHMRMGPEDIDRELQKMRHQCFPDEDLTRMREEFKRDPYLKGWEVDTESDGTFQYRNLDPAKQYRICAVDDEDELWTFPSQDLFVSPPAHGILIRAMGALRNLGALEITVNWEEDPEEGIGAPWTTGQPISIQLLDEAWTHKLFQPSLFLDSNRRFRLERVPPGRYRPWVEIGARDEFGPEVEVLGGKTSYLEMTFQKSHRIVGTCVDEAGKPAAGARLKFQRKMRSTDSWIVTAIGPNELVHSNGNFRWSSRPGLWLLTATIGQEGEKPRFQASVEINAETLKEKNAFRLRLGKDVNGKDAVTVEP